MNLSLEVCRFFDDLERQRARSLLHGRAGFEQLREMPAFQALRARLDERQPDERLLVLLRALGTFHNELSDQLVQADLVATYPGTNSISARHTLHVVRQMIDSARHEIIIAGYAISQSGGIIPQLVEAARRDIRVILICSEWVEPKSGKNVAALVGEQWPSKVVKPEMHVHCSSLTDAAGMHMKCLLIDGTDFLIGSANFTFPGLNTNLELGVRLNGHVARSARAILFEFLHSGMFVSA